MDIKEIFKDVFNQTFSKIGDRMKAFEKKEKKKLTQKLPVIIRLDGRSFSNYTKGFEKPFDEMIIGAMKHTTTKLCEEIQNVKIAYSQSDEITLVLVDYEKEDTQQWFNGELDKILSISSSIATYHFNDYMERMYWSKNLDKTKKPANFDSRAFNIPKHEVNNCLLWRQQDAVRNSISALAQSVYSHKQLHGKNTGTMLEMLKDKNIDWEKLEVYKQRGFCVIKEYFVINADEKDEKSTSTTRSKWVVDDNIPIFSEDRSYVNLLIMIGEIEEKFEKE